MWTINSIRIYVTELSAGDKQIIARLQPLGGGTIHQVFGYENEIFRVKAFVVGESALSSLKGLVSTGTKYNLSGYGTNYGDFYVSSFSWTRIPALYQTLTANCTDPLFQVDLELYS